MKKLIYIIISFCTLILLWELAVLFGGYNETLFPAPGKVASALGELSSNGILIQNIGASLYRFGVGYGLSMVTGVFIGLIAGWFQPVFLLLNPILQIVRPVAPVAWLPFIVLLMGIGDIPAIVIIFLAGFIPVIISTATAVQRMDKTYLKVADNFGIRQPQIVFKIIFPAIFPQIASALRLALGTAWVFLVSGEMMGTQTGLGYMIIDSRNNMRIDYLLAAVVVIGTIGFLLDLLMGMLEKVILKKWGHIEKEA